MNDVYRLWEAGCDDARAGVPAVHHIDPFDRMWYEAGYSAGKPAA